MLVTVNKVGKAYTGEITRQSGSNITFGPVETLFQLITDIYERGGFNVEFMDKLVLKVYEEVLSARPSVLREVDSQGRGTYLRVQDKVVAIVTENEDIKEVEEVFIRKFSKPDWTVRVDTNES